MKRDIIFLGILLIVLFSCESKDDVSQKKENSIVLTKEEYISIAYDNPKEITPEEAIDIVNSFLCSAEQTRASYIDKKIRKKYYMMPGDKEVFTIAASRSSDKAIPVYEVELNDGENEGYSLVSADERYPAVLTYLPKASHQETPLCIGGKLMTEMAVSNAFFTIEQYEKIKEEWRTKTLQRIAKLLHKNEGDISFDQIKGLIQLEDGTSRSEVEKNPTLGTYQTGISPQIKVTWSQNAPYNRKLNQACEYDNVTEGRYAAGCVVVCLAHVLSYFEPAMFADGITIDWKLLKSSPTVKLNDSSTRINQVAILMKFIGNRTNTAYSCEKGGETNTEKAVNNFLSQYNIIADSRCNWDMNKVRVALGNSVSTFKPVIVTGRCDAGGHAWVLDGFQQRRDNTTGQEYYYVHANMGWGGLDDGYFLVESSMNFQCETISYNFNRNIYIYPNVRKK